MTPFLSSRRLLPAAAPIAALVAVLGIGGAVVAQDAADTVEAVDSAGAFEVAGIDVDVVARNAEAAREAGYKEAIRRGWRMLYARMTGQGESAAPGLSAGVLDSLVSGIVVEDEKVGPTRYIARLGVLFDRARTSGLLGVHGQIMRSPPMLMIPVQIEGGAATSVGVASPWHRAWGRFRTGASPIDYIRSTGAGADPILLSWGQTRRGDRNWWLAVLEQYGASDVLTAEARLDRAYPGGPVTGHFTARHGPDGEVFGRFSLRAPNSAQLDRMLDMAVQRIDGIYASALRSGRLKPDPSLKFEEFTDLSLIAPVLDPIVDMAPTSGIELDIDTPDNAAFQSVDQLLRGTQGVRGTSLTSLALGGMSRLRLSFEGPLDVLRYRLDQRGWRLEEAGGVYRLRPRAADEAPLPMPAVLANPPAAAAPTGPAVQALPISD